ncbi:MAG: PfkB family carbohydrate kinase, partial [Bacteroidota bacterium]
MKLDTIDNVFTAFDQQKVMIIGDVMIDSYLWGEVNRISPEAPVPVVNVKKRELRLGGAANVAVNVKALGATPILCSVIGQDSDGDDFLALLDQSHLGKEGIVQSEDRLTTIKHRILSGHQHMLRVDSEVNHAINTKELSQLWERI